MSTRVLKVALFLAILFAIVMLLKDVDFAKALPALMGIDLALLAWVFLLGGVNVFLLSLRWHVLLKAVRDDIAFKNVLSATIGAMAINASGPGKLGMPAKAIFIKKMEKVDINQSIPSIVMELLLELSALTVLLVASATILGMHRMLIDYIVSRMAFWHLFAIGAAFLALVFVVYLFRERLTANDFLKKLSVAVRQTLKRKDIFVLGFVITFANLFVSYLGDQLLFRSLGQQIPYGFIIFTGAFANLAGMLSPLPSGLGVWELSRAYFFDAFYGIAELAVLMTLLRRLMTYVSMGVLYGVNALLATRRQDFNLNVIQDEQILEPMRKVK